METEVWRPIVGHPELDGLAEVSNLGRVRNLDSVRVSAREGQPTQFRRGCLRSPWITKAGYGMITFRIAGRTRKLYVHRLVGLAFVDGHREGATIDHVDGDKLNNRADNLQWVSLAENTRRQWRTGLVNLRGENHPSAKLTDAQRVEVLALFDAGVRTQAIAEQFGVSAALIYKLAKRRNKP